MSLNFVKEYIRESYPTFSSNIPRMLEKYGKEWADDFDNELRIRFGNDETDLAQAVDGYAEFAMDSMLLTAKFQETGEYENKTYEEASREVYQSKEYMQRLYLPGILLSHYLWEHHYKQKIFYQKTARRYVPKNGIFVDVGVGTGFYSKMLLEDSSMLGIGIDMSQHSLSYTRETLDRNKLLGRYASLQGDFYVYQRSLCPVDFICSIEVLEHLENPCKMLQHLFAILKPGGYGIISAAVNAPNADHIYLYRSGGEVNKQLLEAGFTVIDSVEDKAYEKRRQGEIVPVNYCAIVHKPD